MGFCLFSGREDPSGLDDVVCTGVLPWDVGRILLRVEFDFLAIDDQVTTLDFDCAFELAMYRVVFQQVSLKLESQFRPAWSTFALLDSPRNLAQ